MHSDDVFKGSDNSTKSNVLNSNTFDKFTDRMNRYLKIKSVEKIIEERFMKEYNLCPVFNGFKDTMYCRDMKLELFEKETLKGYVLERKYILKKVMYNNGCLDVSIED
jgi:hypothetical protein